MMGYRLFQKEMRMMEELTRFEKFSNYVFRENIFAYFAVIMNERGVGFEKFCKKETLI